MQTIARDVLKQWMDEDRDFTLVEALPRERFEQGHLPGAVNVPVDDAQFEGLVNELLPDREEPVVIYCASLECPASLNEARKLEAMGYRQVYDYEAGKEDWEKAGYELAH